MCQFFSQIVEARHSIEACHARGIGVLRSKLGSRPSFLRRIAIRKKKNFGVRMSGTIFFGLSRGGDEHSRARLAPSGQIKEVIVRTIPVKIVRPLGLTRREEQHHTVLSFRGQGLAAGAIVSVRLTIQCRTQLGRKCDGQK